MRCITKLATPTVLIEKAVKWSNEYKADQASSTKKYRYRHAEIKTVLKEETGFKCIYCESKIGHNTPGDIEHKIPSSKNIEYHFVWENLTIACTECNRRKNDYYESGEEFIDPYLDNVEAMLNHHGPIVTWSTGEKRAEISVRMLDLNSHRRTPLIIRKIEKIEELINLIERHHQEEDLILKSLLHRQIQEMCNLMSEYSGMVLSIVRSKGLTN